mgnify:CR=1 FL=1
MGTRCEIAQNLNGTNILDSVKGITENVRKLLEGTTTITRETAENAVFSMESVVQVGNR